MYEGCKLIHWFFETVLTVDKRKGIIHQSIHFNFQRVSMFALAVAVSACNYPFKHLYLLNTTTENDNMNDSFSKCRILPLQSTERKT